MENSMIPLFHNEKLRLEDSIIGPTIPLESFPHILLIQL
jgi:hypothetical protein